MNADRQREREREREREGGRERERGEEADLIKRNRAPREKAAAARGRKRNGGLRRGYPARIGPRSLQIYSRCVPLHARYDDTANRACSRTCAHASRDIAKHGHAIV